MRHLGSAALNRVEHLERRHQLAGGVQLDLEPAAKAEVPPDVAERMPSRIVLWPFITLVHPVFASRTRRGRVLVVSYGDETKEV